LLRGEQRKSAKAVIIEKTRSAQRENMEPASRTPREDDKLWRDFETQFNQLYPEQQIMFVAVALMKAFWWVRLLVFLALAGVVFWGVRQTEDPVTVMLMIFVGLILGIILVFGGSIFRRK
jgi:hypothetical protein